MIEVNPVAVKLTPPYFAYVLYANHIGGEVVKTLTTSPPVVFNPQLAALDAAATLSAGRHTLYLAAVNRSQSNAVSAQVHLSNWVLGSGEAEVYELNGKSWDAFNPYASTANVNIRQRSIKISRATFEYHFPAHSATVLEVHGNPGATP